MREDHASCGRYDSVSSSEQNNGEALPIPVGRLFKREFSPSFLYFHGYFHLLKCSFPSCRTRFPMYIGFLSFGFGYTFSLRCRPSRSLCVTLRYRYSVDECSPTIRAGCFDFSYRRKCGNVSVAFPVWEGFLFFLAIFLHLRFFVLPKQGLNKITVLLLKLLEGCAFGLVLWEIRETTF